MIATLAGLRRAALGRSLFHPVSLAEAIHRLGFVQADPIRSPARAQDLTLRHRVRDYRAGDLERQYASLEVEEDFLVNYGFLSRQVYALLHPRGRLGRWPAPGPGKAAAVLGFVRERGRVHPREVDSHFSHGAVTNAWGGSSSATTHLLDHLHYRGLLRIAGRDAGIRIYEPQQHTPLTLTPVARRARLDALVDVLLRNYAPLPSPTLAWLTNRLRLAVPQWQADVKGALTRAKQRLAHTRLDGVDWYWPAEDTLSWPEPPDQVRLLAPFDPVVWDRRRFELFWGWAYRFEAYTPAPKRKFGYYALPLLWREQVVGWANVSSGSGGLEVSCSYVSGREPSGRAFARALDEERERLARFLS
jgi:uncharacterized protein YcaQ